MEKKSRKFALVVGNDIYPEPFQSLSKATTDASRVAGFLEQRLEFDVTQLHNESASTVLSALLKIVKQLTDDSQFFFYFAGHGLCVGASSKQSLLCADASELLLDGVVSASGAISPDALAAISRQGRGDMFFCLDVCRTQTLRRRAGSEVQRGGEGLRDAAARPNGKLGTVQGRRLILSSCADGEGAFDDGSFASALVSEMKQALDGGYELELGYDLVRRVTKRLKHGQTPQLDGTPFVLVPGKRRPKPPIDSKFPEGSKPGERRELTLGGVKYGFCWIPPGEFDMGSPTSEKERDDDETLHRVRLTKGFWMLETPTPQSFYEAVMGTNPSRFKGDTLPVESVSWHDAAKFCEKLTKRLSKSMKAKASLPTEAQWEYACRAGTTTPFSFGRSLNGDKANCDGNYPYGTRTKGAYVGRTTPVKAYNPNPWGLYDMHGNVWEWTSDYYGDYPSGTADDPTGPSFASYLALRGGGWYNYARYCRSANRFKYSPDYRYFDLGFRFILEPSVEPPVEPPRKSTSRLKLEADAALSAGRYGDAERAAREALAIDPSRAWAKSLLKERRKLDRIMEEAQTRLDAGDAEGALEKVAVVLDKRPNDEAALRFKNLAEEERARALWRESPDRKAGAAQSLKVGDAEYVFRWIPAGAFGMGCLETERKTASENAKKYGVNWFFKDETYHRVKLTRGFWLLETPVTQSFYERLMKTNPSQFKGDDLPVENVSYDDALTFCAELTKLAPGGVTATLPTEAQWEYACRAGKTAAFWFGGALNGDQANCDGSKPYDSKTPGANVGQTTPVKKYKPNPWGLYDVHGNVFEWTLDYYGAYLQGKVVDPTGAPSGEHRACRGGSWKSPARLCRSAYRKKYPQSKKSSELGFRVLIRCD